MPQRTEHVADKGIVAITYTGRVTIAEVGEATAQAIVFQQAHRTDRVLVNAIAMTAGPSIAEMWSLVESYAGLGVPQRTRVAAVRPACPDDSDLSGFYEVMCQNRCYNAKAFDSCEAAEAWLRADGSAPLP